MILYAFAAAATIIILYDAYHITIKPSSPLPKTCLILDIPVTIRRPDSFLNAFMLLEIAFLLLISARLYFSYQSFYTSDINPGFTIEKSLFLLSFYLPVRIFCMKRKLWVAVPCICLMACIVSIYFYSPRHGLNGVRRRFDSFHEMADALSGEFLLPTQSLDSLTPNDTTTSSHCYEAGYKRTPVYPLEYNESADNFNWIHADKPFLFTPADSGIPMRANALLDIRSQGKSSFLKSQSLSLCTDRNGNPYYYREYLNDDFYGFDIVFQHNKYVYTLCMDFTLTDSDNFEQYQQAFKHLVFSVYYEMRYKQHDTSFYGQANG